MEKNSLWKNIRENRGSGKKPTKEMLKQERKIKSNKYQQGGIPINKNGYYELDPFEDPIVRIPSNNITMKNIEYPIKAIGNSGKDYGYMKPDKDYYFPEEDYIYEIPKAQKGKRSPRHAESEEEKRERLAKYKGGVFNKDYSLTPDIYQRQSREFGVPFVKKELSNQDSNSTISKKRKTESKSFNKKDTSKSYSPDEVDNYYFNLKKDKYNKFQKDFSDEELEKQANDFYTEQNLSKLPEINTNYIPDEEDLNTSINPLKKENYIKSKPIKLDFDNPYEAQAIAYKNLQNKEVLSPFRGNIDLQSPELYQESEIPYLNNIKENRNFLYQQVNPNSTVGQSILANNQANLLNNENQVIGQVNRNNQQNVINYLNQRSDINNKQQTLDYQNDKSYYDDVATLKAIQSESNINYMDSVANMNAKRLQAKNRFLSNAIETGLPSEALDIQDNSVSFDVSKIPYKFKNSDMENDNEMIVKGVRYVRNPKTGNYDVVKKQTGGYMRKYNFKQKS